MECRFNGKVNIPLYFYRIVGSGIKTPKAYFTKFLPEDVNYHPDFQTTASFTMNVIPAGTDDITSEGLETLSSISSMNEWILKPKIR